jgi:PhnB protein
VLGSLELVVTQKKRTGMSHKSTDVRFVIPMLVCVDAASEVDFCKAAFGAVELARRSNPDGSVVHATLTIGETTVMVHGEFPALVSRAPRSDGSSSVVIYVYVEDADTVIERAVLAGAKVLLPASDQFWGDRIGRIIDPSGHVWNVASRVAEASSVPIEQR